MYQTAFDVVDAGYQNLWFCSIGLIPMALGLWWWGLLKAAGQPAAIKPMLIFAFGIAWVVWSFAQTYGEYRTLAGIERKGDFHVVEGEVTAFFPEPYDRGKGQPKESFTVNGIQFEYSEGDATAGFHHTTSHGGPIHDGLHVRIEYYNGQILKLETLS